jgi:hypothetical protein
MTYATLIVKRETSGQMVVGRPNPKDSIGHALRSAFTDPPSVPDEIARTLRRLDALPYRLS